MVTLSQSCILQTSFSGWPSPTPLPPQPHRSLNTTLGLSSEMRLIWKTFLEGLYSWSSSSKEVRVHYCLGNTVLVTPTWDRNTMESKDYLKRWRQKLHFRKKCAMFKKSSVWSWLWKGQCVVEYQIGDWEARVRVLALLWIGCVILGRSCNLSEPQFPIYKICKRSGVPDLKTVKVRAKFCMNVLFLGGGVVLGFHFSTWRGLWH